jgi:hypothetical protein
MCTTTTHWATHVSDECSRGGSGNCEGTCWHDTVCTCTCHEDPNVEFISMEHAQAWHDDVNGVVLRMRGDYVHSLPTWQGMRDKIALQHGGVWDGVRGAQFRLYASDRGHAYIYVEFP